MKRIVLVYGLIAGAIVSTLMLITIALHYRTGKMEGSMQLAYVTMLIAFSLIFIGIKNYRDKYNDGLITFGKAFKTGFFIALIASTLYVLVWLISYYLFMPDYMEKYTEFVLNEAKANGVSAAELAKQTKEMEGYKSMYKNPALIVLLTYAEILPLGLVVAFISAIILKRKSSSHVQLA